MKNPLTPGEVSTYYTTRVPQLNQRGSEWRGKCPLHDGKNPNFAVNAETGKWFCHSKCQRGGSVVDLEMELGRGDFKTAVAEVEQTVGRVSMPATSKRGIVATYDYADQNGTALYQVVRYEPKDFRQRRPDGMGGWIWRLGDVQRVLYRLPRLQAADTVIVAEGEKDVNNLERVGFVATCNAMGAGKWEAQFSDCLAGKRVIVIPDNDEPGRKHARHVVSTLLGKAREVRLVPVPIGKDVSDWIAAGATKEIIEAAIEAAEPLSGEAELAPTQEPSPPAEGVAIEASEAELPEIFVTDRQLRDLRGDCLLALKAKNIPERLFTRGGALVDIREKDAGHQVSADLRDVHVRGLLADAATFLAMTKQGPKNCAPPIYVAQDILASRSLGDHFPQLVGMTELPVERPLLRKMVNKR